jgi:sugar lactone lactonase YvrE
MNLRPLALSLLAAAGLAAADVAYEFAPNALTPPPGKETIGNGHGEIAVDAAGNIYVSVQEKDGLQVYSPEGKYLRNLPGVPNSLHGFVIRKDGDQEVIWAAVLGESRVLKMKLDGTVLLEIPKSAFPADKGGLKLTGLDVAPNGDIYVVDGYGKSWIFVFDKDGKYKTVFGGPVAPWNLANTHKLFIDHRFEPARLFLCDRGNNRLMHLALDGTIIGVIQEGLRRPSSASFNGDLVCIAEIEGRISVLDKDGKTVAQLGTNDTKGQTNTPKVKPADWKDNVVTSPHGITFTAKGDILETEWNEFGRVLRWNRK